MAMSSSSKRWLLLLACCSYLCVVAAQTPQYLFAERLEVKSRNNNPVQMQVFGNLTVNAYTAIADSGNRIPTTQWVKLLLASRLANIQSRPANYTTDSTRWQQSLASMSFNNSTGVLTATRHNGTTTSVTINLPPATPPNYTTDSTRWQTSLTNLSFNSSTGVLTGTRHNATTTTVTITALPSQSGNSGRFLTTNGTAASWAELPLRDIVTESFTSVLKFDRSYTATHTITGAINFTRSAAVTNLSASRYILYLTANGVNKPTFSSDFMVVRDDWVNTNGQLNRVYCEFLPNGKIMVEMIYM